MGYSIPVYFALIESAQIPEKQVTWLDGLPLLDELLENRAASGLLAFTSRNGWHLHTLSNFFVELQMEGVSLADRDLLILDNTALVTLQAALHVLVERRHEIPNLACVKRDQLADVFDPTFTDAFNQAPLVSELYAASYGYQGALDFWSFIKSVQQLVAKALVRNKQLIFIAPQP